MMTFGLSAFLRVACSKPRAQRDFIRKRLLPRKKGGYDFHKEMRSRAHRFLFGGISAEELIGSLDDIVKAPERRAAVTALQRLTKWRSEHPAPLVRFEPAVFESPNAAFKVRFEPDFGMGVTGRLTAIHLWNTKSVDLIPHRVLATLSLFRPAFDLHANSPEDLAVFSLRNLRMYRLGETSIHASAGTLLVEKVEIAIDEIRSDLGLPPPGKPSSPPPPPSA